MSSAGRSLPLSLLDLTFAQARQPLACSSSQSKLLARAKKTKTNVLFVRQGHAHALAIKSKAPDVREGYLRPLAENDGELGLERRRRPLSIAKNVRRTETRQAQAPSYPALLLHDRVDELVRRTTVGGELYSPETQEDDLVGMEDLHYSETELRDLYTDLLAHPQSELEAQSHFRAKSKPDAQKKEEEELETRKARLGLLEAVKSRLIVESDLEGENELVETIEERRSLASRLSARRKASSDSVLGEKEEVNTEKDLLGTLREKLVAEKLHHNILLRITDVVRSIEDAQKIIGNPSSTNTPLVTVLSSSEWDVLVRTCMDENEMDVAEDSLLLMKRCGTEPGEELVNDVLNVHATRGDVTAVMSFFEKLAINKPTERQRDMHIKAHLKSSSPSHGIPSALKVLHNYESLALLPPVKSYTRLICSLFSQRSAQYQAQAWDLFSHMRYVAHAKPDPALYALMIRACAGTGYSQSGYAADPVRALDLWTEMTTEAGYAPTVGAYNAIILACARSREYVGEAFRLAREMLDGHRDAYGYPLMHATQETFNALLVAAKTRKDLPRARWILAEMLKIYEQGIREGVDTDVQPDERTVMHVLHAYASYWPPFRRGDTAIVDEGELENSQQGTNADALPAPGKEIEKTPTTKARFSVTPPQTRQEVLAEADTLFERVLSETGLHPSSPAFSQSDSAGDPPSHPGPFSRVHLTSPLLNSYLSVHYIHDTLENSRKIYDEVFRRTGVERSPRTYVDVLERCQRSEKEERPFAKAFANDVWKEWLEMEKRLDSKSAEARMIERAYAAMIRMFALIGDLDSSLSLLRTFTTRYPPHAISNPSAPKSEMRSTRTVLYAHRPLIRLTTPAEVQDDAVPPLLTPRDLELLHHRLVAAGPARHKDLDWLTYLGHVYLGSLRKRRDRTIRA